MNLDSKLIDIDFLPNRDLIYSGYCIKHNKQVMILVNYNSRIKHFDGFTVFRPKEITKYRFWLKAEIQKIKKDNRQELASLLNVDKMNTFYSCLKLLGNDTLIAFFKDNITEKYIVGKIVTLTRESVTLQLINKSSKWTSVKKLRLADINYFSFMTQYEQKLISNVTV
jgi:hypothetical protein